MTDGVTEQIVRAIAREKKVGPTELEIVLQEYVDPDALRLLSEHENSEWTLTFSIDDYEVTVTHEGTVLVDEDRCELSA